MRSKIITGGKMVQEKIKIEWEEQENSSFWKPENKGDEVIGDIIGINESPYGQVFVLELEDKSTISIPNHKALINKLGNTKIGDTIKIVFEGKDLPKVKGHNPTNLYTVYIKKQ